MASTIPFTLDVPTLLCIGFALSFMPIAYLLGTSLIPSSQTRNRILFYWHAYDALTHIFIEGSFLYECFYSYTTLPAGFSKEPYFLGYKDRVYGAAYGTGPSARLWQEYAKADRRWAVADATTISIELLTVFLGGPAAVYVCYLLWKASSSSSASTASAKGAAKARLWLVAPALATAELYGGFMTFAPEWLTGSSQLDTSNAVYLWFYLFFFNTLWVWIPLWVLWEAAKELRAAFVMAEKADEGRKRKGCVQVQEYIQTLTESIALLLDLLECTAQEFLEANNRTGGFANDQRISTVHRFVPDEGERKLLLREVLRGAVMDINHLAREIHYRRSARSVNVDSMTSGSGESELTGKISSLLERTYAALAWHGEVASRSTQKRPRALAYQMWSARMELQTSRCIRYNQGPLLGPPGSPESGLLGSFSSERTALLEVVPRTIDRRTANPSSDATSHAVSMKQPSDHERRRLSDKDAQNYEAEHQRFKQQHRIDNSSCRSAEVRDLGLDAGSPGGVQSSPRSNRVERARKLHKVNNSTKLRKKHQSKARHQAPRKVPLRRLSTWESRLAHDLNRKLEWLIEQLSPGRRPFHFALLANHWLNRETWVVLDPISRVPIEARRLWGDPRFNSPYPMPRWEPRPKYPESPCKTANRPHLNSWRVAVNRNRRASGLRDVVRSAALLEGSDEPPDGKVDPASWILRRPPQGFAMSTTQQDAFYEGGAGWQETLGDWQRVRRGYRIRKAIYEGRANRTRMKEIAVGLTRYFQAITNEALKIPQTDAA
ncbi:hypothetical protein CDV55_108636 [Aspergillus turcosus]|uniref:EXPERA domain-containing protein n=1 Tax=Aspergillus turcosus TaxID=1245748 RepID=A0A229XBT7_9EURO|nr:hypothetical protein CDV55_108636 [Aspergillus turcosus]RLM01885.1 hypothetical protein CFD26_104414 [Aspergillus turcosus]